MYTVVFTKKAERGLVKLGQKDKNSILGSIGRLDYPFPQGLNIVALGGVKDFYRLRKGKVRVIFEVDRQNKKIWIRKIDYRASVYKGSW